METAALLGSASMQSTPGTVSKRRLMEDEESTIGLFDHAQIAAGRLMHAPSCGAFYLSLLAASLTEIIWISHPWLNRRHCCRLFYPQSRIFFIVEAYLTLGLVAETSLTLLWQRKAFWKSIGNWFDAIVCATSVMSFGLYWFGGATGLLDEALLFVMVGWLALRIARLTMVVQKLLRERSRRSMAAHLDIAFPDVEDDDEDEDEESDLVGADVDLESGRRDLGPQLSTTTPVRCS